jgi:hypothetical protein
MRPQAETVRLGAHAWRVRPLTLAQVQEIEPILMQGETRGTVAAAIAILEIALRRDHAAAADGLADIEATAPEIGAAMRGVLRLGGFIEAEGDEKPGEAGAGLPPATSLPASTSA